MATHSSTLAWKIPWTEEPGRLQSMGLQRSDMTEWLHFHFPLSCIGEGNGNPLQCSCLENPRDGRVWWAALYRVAQSRTRLKQLSSSSSSQPKNPPLLEAILVRLSCLLGEKLRANKVSVFIKISQLPLHRPNIRPLWLWVHRCNHIPHTTWLSSANRADKGSTW